MILDQLIFETYSLETEYSIFALTPFPVKDRQYNNTSNQTKIIKFGILFKLAKFLEFHIYGNSILFIFLNIREVVKYVQYKILFKLRNRW